MPRGRPGFDFHILARRMYRLSKCNQDALKTQPILSRTSIAYYLSQAAASHHDHPRHRAVFPASRVYCPPSSCSINALGPPSAANSRSNWIAASHQSRLTLHEQPAVKRTAWRTLATAVHGPARHVRMYAGHGNKIKTRYSHEMTKAPAAGKKLLWAAVKRFSDTLVALWDSLA